MKRGEIALFKKNDDGLFSKQKSGCLPALWWFLGATAPVIPFATACKVRGCLYHPLSINRLKNG